MKKDTPCAKLLINYFAQLKGGLSMDEESSYILKDSYIDKMMDYLQNDSLIPEDFMHLFYFKIMKAFTEKAYDSISDHAKIFCLYMSHVWSSQIFMESTSNPALIFQLGELHTCAKVLDDFFSEKEKENNIEENSIRFFNRKRFFEYIANNPGIKHSDLASKMDISLSNLSQFVSKIKGYKYHIERVCGREKYYYLTKTGIALLKRMEEMEKEKEDEEKNTAACVVYNPGYKNLNRYVTWIGSGSPLCSIKNNPDSEPVFSIDFNNYPTVYFDSFINNSALKSYFKPRFSNQHKMVIAYDDSDISSANPYFINSKTLSNTDSLFPYTILIDYCIKNNRFSTALSLTEKLYERIKQIETEKYTLEKKTVDLPNDLQSTSVNWIDMLIENEPSTLSLPSANQYANKKKTLVKDILSNIQEQKDKNSEVIYNSSRV